MRSAMRPNASFTYSNAMGAHSDEGDHSFRSDVDQERSVATQAFSVWEIDRHRSRILFDLECLAGKLFDAGLRGARHRRQAVRRRRGRSGGQHQKWAGFYARAASCPAWPFRFLRIDSPCNSILCAACTSRSKMLSATVGSPICPCHLATGNWLVSIVAPVR